jgi:hypothetical protein
VSEHGRTGTESEVRTMFWVYLVFVACGLVTYTVIGIAHY